MPTLRRLGAAAAVVLAAGATASPALGSSATPRVDLRMPDTRDVAAGRRPPATTRPVVVRLEPGADRGLSWDSALIGAIAGAGLLASATGGVLLVTRRRPGLQ